MIMKVYTIVLSLLLTPLHTKGQREIEQSKSNLQTVIKILLGQACLCKCGVPNFDIGEYRQEDVIKEIDISNNANSINTNETNVDIGASTGIIPNSTLIRNVFENDDEKLIGGDNLKTNGFPWLVNVIVKGVVSAGGAILTDKHIISSASPFVGVNSGDVKISVGSHDRCSSDVNAWNISVSSVNSHPSFLISDHRHDLAILTLSGKIYFNKVISPICLPSLVGSYTKHIYWIASWLAPVAPSFLLPHPQPNCVPKVVRLPLLTNDECLRASSTIIQLTFDKSCLGPFGASTQICAGDVGSPVQFLNKNGQFELSGIVLSTNACDNTQPAIFTRIDQHILWIRSKINSGCLCTS